MTFAPSNIPGTVAVGLGKIEEYQTAIDILMGEADLRAIAIEIAKLNPAIFIDAAARVGFMPPKQSMVALRAECRALLNDGNKIAAIRRWRTVTNTGLREAKEAVEAL